MTREEGYYWVKRNGRWVIAEWTSPYTDKSEPEWCCMAWLMTSVDSDFEEIDERRITREPIIRPQEAYDNNDSSLISTKI